VRVWGALYSHRQALVRYVRDAVLELLDDPIEVPCWRFEVHGLWHVLLEPKHRHELKKLVEGRLVVLAGAEDYIDDARSPANVAT
jgi:hypothetical protein